MQPNTMRQRLHMAGDVEKNPGPQRTGENNEKQCCRNCSGTIKRGNDFLTCKKCKGTFHKQKGCSGETKHRLYYMTNSRRTNWRCRTCKGVTPQSRNEHTDNTSGANRRNTDESTTRYCRICKGIVRRGYDSLECSECGKPVHKKKECSDETIETVKKLDRAVWRCRGCIQSEAERETTKNYVEEGDEVEYVMRAELGKKGPIKILQWNADSISTKKEELKALIKEKEIDVFLIQETKMTRDDKPLSLPGYTILSKPRQQVAGNEKNRGGGLLIGIRRTIPFREIKKNNLRDADDEITEWQTIEIPISQKEKLRVTNIYIPSERRGDSRGSAGETVLTTRLWPTNEHDIVAGDINAHALAWDGALVAQEMTRGLEEKRGEMVEEWMMEKNMACLNTGRATHTNRRTGKESAPDITMVHGTQIDRYDWEILEELGGSDHKPILITRLTHGAKMVNTKPTYKWN